LTQERYIITSALPYINGIKHLGNLIGSILPADVYTRYLRLIGKDVIYICGTDEHGTIAELAALEENMDVRAYCDKYYHLQKDTYERFGVDFDYFGRTSDEENHELTQEIFKGLYKNGYIKEITSNQLYSIDDKRFLPDRYVIGICPNCNYERARGDQCESCTSLIDPTDLINPMSSISGSTNVEVREVTHLYLDLPKLQDRVAAWVEGQEHWSKTAISIANKWIKEGLKVRSITRNLNWGISVPLKEHSDLVFYVWFDAPIGYLSITKKWARLKGNPELFDLYWKSPDSKLIQFMGKDNVPFHSVTFPCSLLGSETGYNLVYNLKGFQYLGWEGGKFSTSQQRGLFCDEALDIFPADYWRWYLLSITPERIDTDFQLDGLINAVNNDLNNLLGNLLNRCTTFIHRHYDHKVPEVTIPRKKIELYSNLSECIEEYTTTFNEVEFQKPIRAIRKFLQECNKYFQESEPWKLITSQDPNDAKQAKLVISNIAHALRSIAILIRPIIPFSAEDLYTRLGYDGKDIHTLTINQIEDWKISQGIVVPVNKTNIFNKISIDDYEKGIAKARQTDNPKESEIDPKTNQVSSTDSEKNKEYIDYETFAKVKLITAKVLDVQPHPKADKLLVLKVDDGKGDRTIVAGIAQYYKPDDLTGKTIIIVENLQPRKLRGITSEGMILAVDHEDTVVVLQPEKPVGSGLQIR